MTLHKPFFSLPPPSFFYTEAILSHQSPCSFLRHVSNWKNIIVKQLKPDGVVTPRAAVTEYHTLGRLKRQTRHSLTVLEDRGPKSRWWQDRALAQGSGAGSSLASSSSQGAPSRTWLSWARRHITPISASVFTRHLCASLYSNSPLLITTPVLLGRHNTPRDEVCEM